MSIERELTARFIDDPRDCAAIFAGVDAGTDVLRGRKAHRATARATDARTRQCSPARRPPFWKTSLARCTRCVSSPRVCWSTSTWPAGVAARESVQGRVRRRTGRSDRQIRGMVAGENRRGRPRGNRRSRELPRRSVRSSCCSAGAPQRCHAEVIVALLCERLEKSARDA
jgi:hypothetical protein